MAISKLTGSLTTMGAFNMAKQPDVFGWARILKFAFVNLSEESKEAILLAETVAVNRGYKLTKVFDNEKDAKEWLLK